MVKLKSSRSKILSFLFAHHEFFINHLSGVYPLSPAFIEKHKDLLNWYSLTSNEELPWSTEFFMRFDDYWYYGTGDDDLEFSVVQNKAIEWDMQLIEKYHDKVDWQVFSQSNKLLLENPGIFDKFKDKLCWEFISGNEYLPWTEQFIEKFKDYWNWDYLSGNRGINWSLSLMKKYKKFNIERYRKGNNEPWLDIKDSVDLTAPVPKKENTFDSQESVDFNLLSCNEKTQWSEAIINRNKDKWNWEYLSENSALPWSEELIDRYIDRWEFGHPIYHKNEMILISGLSSNPALNWSSSLINKYKDHWFWYTLSYNEGIPWSLDIINEFYDLWVWESLTWNMKLWEKVFYPYLDYKNIDDILCRIRKKFAGGQLVSR